MRTELTGFEEDIALFMTQLASRGHFGNFLVIVSESDSQITSFSNITDQQELVHYATQYVVSIMTGKRSTVEVEIEDTPGPI